MTLHRISTGLGRFAKQVRAFRASRSGHVAVVFAFAIAPIFGSLGTALDLSRADRVQGAMQVALDATAHDLAGSVAGLSEAELSARAEELFRSYFRRADAYSVAITPHYAAFGQGFVLTVSGSATVQSRFVRLLGVSDFVVTGATEIVGGIKIIEVAGITNRVAG